MRDEAAATAFEKPGCEVFKLYADNSETHVMNPSEIAEHAKRGGIFGVTKETWVAAVEKENSLKNAEMSMEDDYGMIDGIINNGPKEEKQPETVKRASIMDRLKEAKSEKPIKKDAPAKAKSNDLEI